VSAHGAVEEESGSEVDEDSAIQRLIQMRRDDRMAVDEHEHGETATDEGELGDEDDGDMSYAYDGESYDDGVEGHMNDEDEDDGEEEEDDDEEEDDVENDGDETDDEHYSHKRNTHGGSSSHENGEEGSAGESEDGNFFSSWHRRRGHGGGLFDTLSSGLMMSGFSMRIRPILANLKNHEDISAIMAGLQELAENLLVSTEDLLIGFFPSEQCAEELVSIMRDPIFEDNPEILLLACRDLYNLMEALPSSISHVVNAGAIPTLCQKLLEINYIDLAEQALSVSVRVAGNYGCVVC
jgi:E3 ubiquitin-protein ligase TRIP12